MSWCLMWNIPVKSHKWICSFFFFSTIFFSLIFIREPPTLGKIKTLKNVFPSLVPNLLEHMGDIRLFITVLLTNNLVFTMEFGKVSSYVNKDRVHLYFKTEDTTTESVHILANLNYDDWVFICLRFGLVLSFWIFFSYLSSFPSVFHTKHLKHSEECATVLFFSMTRNRGVRWTRRGVTWSCG